MIPAACLHRNGSEALIGAGLPAVRSAGMASREFSPVLLCRRPHVKPIAQVVWGRSLANRRDPLPGDRRLAMCAELSGKPGASRRRGQATLGRGLCSISCQRARAVAVCHPQTGLRRMPGAGSEFQVLSAIALASPRCRQLRGHDGRCHAFSLSVDPHAALPWPRVHVDGTTGKCCGSSRSASTQEGLNHETQNLPHASTRPTAPHEGLAHARQYGEGRPHHAVR